MEAHTPMLQVGIDMSLTSPGMTLSFRRPSSQRVFHMIGYQNRVTKELCERRSLRPDFILTVRRYPIHINERWEKLDWLLKDMMGIIKDERATGELGKVHVFIENYALGMRNSSSVSVLCEIGGVLRYLLLREGWSFSVISPTAAKKHFAGRGGASKLEMGEAYLQLHHYPDIQEIIKSRWDQHPVEDMVDSLAILLTGLGENKIEPPKPPQRRKRKAADVGSMYELDDDVEVTKRLDGAVGVPATKRSGSKSSKDKDKK